jgi:WD40 repeat protein
MCNVQLNAQQPTSNSAEIIATLKGHTHKIDNFRFDPTGRLISAATDDGTVVIWHTTGERVQTIVPDAHTSTVAMLWSPDGKQLAINYWHKKSWALAVWDIASNSRIFQIPNACLVEWNLNNRSLLVLDSHSKLAEWDVASASLVMTLNLSIKELDTIKFNADGQRVIKYSFDGPAELWDITTNRLVTAFLPTSHEPYHPNPYASRLSPDRRLLIRDATSVLDVTTQQQLVSFTDGNYAVSFSPNSRSLVSIRNEPLEKLSHRQSYLTIWTTNGFKELSTFNVPEGVHEVVWSPNGETVAIVGLNFNTRLIDTSTGRENGRLPYGNCWPWTMFGTDGCEPINFSADGRVIVKQREPIKLWRGKDVSLICELQNAHLPAVFSPTENELLATRTRDKKGLLLWRIKA